ncbi:hypothetical protein D5S18_03890 [Nocardia panacis]|uniref:Mammalian cell entry protein n=1 Tax=Nocardia panacis TaxID=2340916 RepID=A0A3A4KGY8_9NOCA|nr:hypothetical protein [Nocardia panacis]RJO78700.1 hypothetical protein D5S18_03890 [Nocardia panacis]
MSGSTVSGRNRRKAVRSAGPPVGDPEDTAARKDTVSLGKSAAPVRPAAASSDAVGSGTAVAVLDRPVAEDAASVSDAPPDSPRSRWRVIAGVLAALLVVLLVGGAGFAGYEAHLAGQRNALRADYLQFGKQAAINMTTIRADSVQQDADRVYAMSSGSFRTEFDNLMKDFIGFVTEAKVRSTGQVAEVAVESSDEHSARVLVASLMTVQNAGLDQPQQRVFRMRITIARDGNALSVSGLEFVS